MDWYKWLVFLQGISGLLPWNLFITANAYFMQRFSSTPFESTFLNYFSVAFNTSTLVTITIYTLLGNKVQLAAAPFLFMMILLLLFTTLSIATHFHGKTYFYTTITIIFSSGIASALLQNSVLQNLHSPKHIQYFMSGQALSGLAISVCNLLLLFLTQESIYNPTIHQLPHLQSITIQQSTFIYFSVGTTIILLTTIGTLLTPLPKISNPNQLPLLDQTSTISSVDLHLLEIRSSIYPVALVNQSSDAALPVVKQSAALDIQPAALVKQSAAVVKQSAAVAKQSAAVVIQSQDAAMQKQKNGVISLLKNELPFAILTVFSTFSVTLSQYPNIVSELSNQHDKSYAGILFVLFNLGDFLGRMISFDRIPVQVLFMLSLLRIGFLTIFQTAPFMSIFIFGISNGYLVTISLFHSDISNNATKMLFTISIGLCFGALCAMQSK